MTDIRDLLGEGFPAVERGSIKVFPDGLPAEWFKFLDESPWFIKGMSPEHAMQIASMLATDAFLTIQIWANEAWRQRELRRELAAALREEREKRRFWNNRNYQLVDKVRDQDWHLAYERAMREVVERVRARGEGQLAVYFPPNPPDNERIVERGDADYERACLRGIYHFLAQFTSDQGENPYCEDLAAVDQALAAAREEIERMKVCCLCSRLTGNWVFMCCAEMMEENSAENPDEWPHSSTVVKLDDHCHFTPSRWTPRTPKEA